MAKKKLPLALKDLKDPPITLVELLKQYKEPQIRGAMSDLLKGYNINTSRGYAPEQALSLKLLNQIVYKMLFDIIRGNTNMSDTVVSQLHHYTK